MAFNGNKFEQFVKRDEFAANGKFGVSCITNLGLNPDAIGNRELEYIWTSLEKKDDLREEVGSGVEAMTENHLKLAQCTSY